MSRPPNQTSRPPPNYASKIRGCLLGAAIGDALGAPYEGSAAPPIAEDFAPAGSPMRYTDDTHMTIGVAQSLIDRRGFNGDHMAHLLKENYEREPWRGYGAGPPEVFRKMAEGAPWDQAAHSLFGGTGSFGNGAAMRVTPVATFAFDDLSLVAEIARQSAIITHTHELGVEGAVLQATAIARLIRSDPRRGLDTDGLLSALKASVSGDAYHDKLQRVGELMPAAGREQIVARLGNSIAAFESVPTALYCFLRHPTSFESTVRFAISLGGDTDTIASMAGALAGAFLGEEAIPYDWAGRVEGYSQILSLADDLVDLHFLPANLS